MQRVQRTTKAAREFLSEGAKESGEGRTGQHRNGQRLRRARRGGDGLEQSRESFADRGVDQGDRDQVSAARVRPPFDLNFKVEIDSRVRRRGLTSDGGIQSAAAWRRSDRDRNSTGEDRHDGLPSWTSNRSADRLPRTRPNHRLGLDLRRSSQSSAGSPCRASRYGTGRRGRAAVGNRVCRT